MKSGPVLPEVGLEMVAPASAPSSLVALEEVEEDEWDMPVFAFHDLDYIPSGYGGILAPYIETGPGTMRAAATLMGLDPSLQLSDSSFPIDGELVPKQQVICDLGCGDGEFLIGLLRHVNESRSPSPMSYLSSTTPLPATGLGIDYNGPLIATATLNAIDAQQTSSWLVYDFNLDADDLLAKLVGRGVTHVFVYLVPKQLALGTVRRILEGCVEKGMMVCAHKFMPEYLGEGRTDRVMDLRVFEK